MWEIFMVYSISLRRFLDTASPELPGSGSGGIISGFGSHPQRIFKLKTKPPAGLGKGVSAGSLKARRRFPTPELPGSGREGIISGPKATPNGFLFTRSSRKYTPFAEKGKGNIAAAL